MRDKNGEWRWLLSRQTPFQRNTGASSFESVNNAEHTLRTNPVGSRMLTLRTHAVSLYDSTQWGVPSVADRECGIPAYTLPRVFDLFFTTKDISEGTGLGLSVSHGIIESQSGNME